MKSDYSTKKWRDKRLHILRRDGWIDQYMIRQGVKIEASLVHHILPKEDFPEYQWADWNLISVSETTHKHVLHEKFSGKLTRAGRMLMFETAAKNGVKIQMLTMVIGLPGSGKTTYVKQHLEGGLAYDLDAIAAAFRLSKDSEHSAARRMAAALREGWIQAAPNYSNRLFVIRSAPDLDELSRTNPDHLVICTEVFDQKKYKFDVAEYKARIKAAEDWARNSGIRISYYPE